MSISTDGGSEVSELELLLAEQLRRRDDLQLLIESRKAPTTVPPPPRLKGRERNQPCVCGSGLKAKRCPC